MRKLWLSCALTLSVAVVEAQAYVRDNLFNLNLPTSTINVRDMIIYSDKRILIGGEFHQYAGSFSWSKVMRLKATGEPDPTFAPPLIAGGRINSIAIQPWDSAIIIAGAFNTVNGVNRSGIARLLPDGSLDASFNPGSGISGGYAGDLIIWSVAVRNDLLPANRRIVAGGQFNYYNGTLISEGNGGGLVQIKTDGSLDALNSPVIDGGPVYTLTVDDASGKIIAGGEFYRVNRNDCWRFVRINTNGTTDATMWTGRWDGFSSSVGLVKVYKNKIYVGGYFTQYRGNNAGKLARVNWDGSYDNTFNTANGFSGSNSSGCVQGLEAKCLAFMSNDKVLVGGNFTTYAGNTVYRIARLNTDGSFDATCITGTGFDQCLQRIAFQGTDDSLVCAGFFNSYKGESQGTVLRMRKPPVTMLLTAAPLQLEGARHGERAQLQWEVPDGASGRVMELLRSNDGRQFTTVHSRATQTGVTRYQYSDAPGQGNVWYRMQLTDGLGRTSQSPVVEIRGSDGGGTFFPNPCTDRLTARLPVAYSGTVSVSLSSLPGTAGKAVQLRARGGIVEIPVAQLAAGTYYAVVRTADGTVLHSGMVVRAAR